MSHEPTKRCIKCHGAIKRGQVCDLCTTIESAAITLFDLSYNEDRDRWAKEASRKVEFWRTHGIRTLDGLEAWANQNDAPVMARTCRQIRNFALAMGQAPNAVFVGAAKLQDTFSEAMRQLSKQSGLNELAEGIAKTQTA